MDSVNTYWADRAMLEWQVDLGADEAIQDTPVDRYALDPALPKPAAKVVEVDKPAPPPIPARPQVDGVAEAAKAAGAAGDLVALATAVAGFVHCDLKKGARNTVWSDGTAGARLMIIGEAPDRDEDRAGQPFVAATGRLLDNMLAAIAMGRGDNGGAYLTCALPWRVAAGDPAAADMEIMRPFLERHIALANPDVVVLMGNTACQMLLGRGGITRMRGQWAEVLGRPAMPMFHPAQLLQNPAAKRDAWADLLAIQARLRETR